MLKQLNFRYKIFVIPAFTVIGMLLGLLLNLYQGNRNLNRVDSLINGQVPAWELGKDMSKTLEQFQRSLQDAVAGKDTRSLKSAESNQKQLLEKLDFAIKNFKNGKAVFEDIKGSVSDYTQSAIGAVSRILQNEKGDNAPRELENAALKYTALKSKLESNLSLQNYNLTESFKQIKRQNNAMIITSLVVIGIFIVLSILLSMSIANSIVKPVQVAIDMTKKVSDGDLTVKVPVTGQKDEAGTLLSAFDKMVGTLRTMTEQTKEVVNALSSASTEISASVTEIASGATQTATAANETSTTVEEVRQTAMDSNRKSKHVSESAQKAVQISQAGEKAVAATIDGMRRIERQMESIAESIMKLSEHGQAIGGIIATVEDVAEQSNLLAVNASIEAARAGEHGKGFAVVAQEVKSLAEQSKQATSKVRNILDDIQKATSGAVMTTEQGSKAVEAGVKQSTDAGEAIQRLANSVAEAAQATTQISVSSQEQVVGMDQVVSAMESIKQASTQNVTATRQVESAAQDLQELGHRLKNLVDLYHL